MIFLQLSWLGMKSSPHQPQCKCLIALLMSWAQILARKERFLAICTLVWYSSLASVPNESIERLHSRHKQARSQLPKAFLASVKFVMLLYNGYLNHIPWMTIFSFLFLHCLTITMLSVFNVALEFVVKIEQKNRQMLRCKRKKPVVGEMMRGTVRFWHSDLRPGEASVSQASLTLCQLWPFHSYACISMCAKLWPSRLAYM